MGTENIVTGPFRLAFPEVFTPKAGQEGGRKKYSITMLFPKSGEQLIPGVAGPSVLDLRRLAFAAIKEKWGEDKTKWPPSIKAIDFKNYVSPTGKDGWPIRDGDLVEWDGFAGCVFVRASSQYQPGLVNNKLQKIMSEEDVFGGLICRAQVNAYAYDSNGNKGVTFGLSNLQVLKDDGTIYGSRQDASEVFDAFGAEGGAGMEGFDEELPF